ncbi:MULTISPECIES: MucR family transcriptional regulator [Kordiimonas]|uniref:MucR family transcriptional regulator n=1 Tax=Kordiimonas TaxID=288021 RepID=UPI001FF390FB|nr:MULTISPECIES: MucR family transcriptional regulator [Kordiimonas]MCK0070413.1 MucR family transcriptional regulator [Kordiimonas laminariae]UTW57556.1 MucR family transcriptional regulator [Kordiimonas sp. SCSIO 12603]
MTTESVNINSSNELLGLAAEIVTAYVSNNTVNSSELPDVIKTVYSTLSTLGPDQVNIHSPKPAVPLKKSFTNEYIVCLEDGKKLKMLKRYLRSHYDMSPEEYRAKWGLPADYPMVAPAYAAKRSEFAKKIGLGKKR